MNNSIENLQTIDYYAVPKKYKLPFYKRKFIRKAILEIGSLDPQKIVDYSLRKCNNPNISISDVLIYKEKLKK